MNVFIMFLGEVIVVVSVDCEGLYYFEGEV